MPFTAALAGAGLDELLDARLLYQLRSGAVAVDPLDDEQLPVLITMSDNGPQMRSHSTREFMAACAIMQRFGRPYTPSDQAWIESLFGHVKSEWSHLKKIRNPSELTTELERSASSTTPCACTRASATSPPTTNTTDAATPCAKPDETPWPRRAYNASTTVEHSRRTTHDRASNLVG